MILPATIALAVGAGALVALPLTMRHRRIGGDEGLSLPAYARCVVGMTGFWIVGALAFCSYWLALPQLPLPSAALLEVASAYLLSWAAGFVAVFAPQGIGVFEFSIAALLLGDATGTVVDTVVLVAGFRAVVLVADIAAYAMLRVIRLLGGRFQIRRR